MEPDSKLQIQFNHDIKINYVIEYFYDSENEPSKRNVKPRLQVTNDICEINKLSCVARRYVQDLLLPELHL
jgi:hypothetical protein